MYDLVLYTMLLLYPSHHHYDENSFIAQFMLYCFKKSRYYNILWIAKINRVMPVS